MKLNVEYKTDNRTIKRVFKGNDIFELLKKARDCDLYRKCHEATFELEEVDEHGNNCGECQKA